MRGFKRDNTLTALAQQGMYSAFPSAFVDRRSYVSLEKVTPHTLGFFEPHLLLFGKDLSYMRDMLVRMCILENGYLKCCICGQSISDEVHEMASNKAQLDHKNNKAGERCDCPENIQLICRNPCHASKHPDGRLGT